MSRSITLCAAIPLIVGRVSAGDQLPGTLNFANVTGDRIVQTVPETASNQKEVEFGDFDNDGDLDVVVANAHSDFGQRRNKLYRNDNGVFTEVSGEPIIPEFSNASVSRNVFFRDYNGDGWLDIIIINGRNSGGDAGRSKLFLNRQEDGRFSFFEEVGLKYLGGSFGGPADGAISEDLDLDGDFDVYVGNEPSFSQDTMYFNDGDGFFENVTATHVPIDGHYTDDVAAADMNGDGKLDLLVTNGPPDNFIYYNDNGRGSSGLGDFRYGPDGLGGVQSLGTAYNQSAMEPGDFDNDGDQDIYWVGKGGGPRDRVLRNDGNDEDNRATFSVLDILPASVTEQFTRKATVADLNDDGRLDVFVGGHTTRPAILRNTTVNGRISFVDWTPGDEIPNGSQHRGWHAAAFDSNNDGDIDIFLGGWTNDHLFENVPSNEVDEDHLDGLLPPVYNTDPVAVLGHSEEDEIDIYVADDIGDDSFIAVVLNGPDDYLLEVLDVDDVLLGASDRGGLGIEEAMQITITTAGTYKVRVTVNESAGSQFDLDGDGSVGVSDLLSLLGQWGTDPGGPPDFDGDGTVGVSDLLALLINWGRAPSSNDYVLEVLSRTGP
ncbi:MAG: VCBS repeat-containing protein [Planctomycetes bacterium]|nr:VCBS repeat-containing protein [Planctomycetota bacterium]